MRGETSASFSPRGGAIRLFLAENLAGDDHALDLAGAFADGAELHVAIKLFGRIVFDEAVAAVDLHRLVGHANSNFAGVEFGHAGFLGDARVVVSGSDVAIVEPGGL